jgi:hypothetical protein
MDSRRCGGRRRSTLGVNVVVVVDIQHHCILVPFHQHSIDTDTPLLDEESPRYRAALVLLFSPDHTAFSPKL